MECAESEARVASTTRRRRLGGEQENYKVGVVYFFRTVRVMKGIVNGFDVACIFLYSSRISRIAL
jgi:hypothetical protein